METVWVVSFAKDNYFPVEQDKQKVLDHNKKCYSDEILEYYDDKEDCEERCNYLNSR